MTLIKAIVLGAVLTWVASPTYTASRRGAGCHVVTMSGDKLIGGPQAGILAGRADLVEALRRNPLARALRIDKLTLAALQATLLSYATDGGAEREIPMLRMLLAPLADVDRREGPRARPHRPGGPSRAARAGRRSLGATTLAPDD